MKKLLTTVVAFIIVTFGVQGMSHFVINVEHFAAIDFVRAEPVLALGFLVMIIQALIMGLVMGRLFPGGATLMQGLYVSGAFGLFLGSYIALTEPAKYAAPSIGTWLAVEGMASFIQFGIFGLVLGLIYQKGNAAAKSSTSVSL